MIRKHSQRREVQPENEVEKEQNSSSSPHQRLCDFCGESRALLYCRADSAKLCFSCDREVHLANPLFTKHTRSLLCDACDSNPASILCSSQNLVLCQNCDWDNHGRSIASLHDRRPIEGFSGCPSGIELSSILGFEDLGEKSLFLAKGVGDDDFLAGSVNYESMGVVDGFLDMFVWDTSPVVSLDDLIGSTDSNHNFQAMGIPPLPKNRNAACGKHKEEILHQLCGLVKLEPGLNDDHGDFDMLLESQPTVQEQNLRMTNFGAGFEHDAEPILPPSYETCELQWQHRSDEAADEVPVPFMLLGNYNERLSDLDKPADIDGSPSYGNGDLEGQLEHPSMAVSSPVLPKVAQHELASHDRGSMISRYKEKKKARRYDKHVRYESRKARADSRARIKGRFAKVNQ